MVNNFKVTSSVFFKDPSVFLKCSSSWFLAFSHRTFKKEKTSILFLFLSGLKYEEKKNEISVFITISRV